MKVTKTKKLNEQVAFKTPQDAIRAIQSTPTLKTDVRKISTSTEFQLLVKHLTTLPHPFSVVVVTPKEG